LIGCIHPNPSRLKDRGKWIPEKVLTGNWVNEKYIKEIQSDTPVRNAQDVLMVLELPEKFNDTGYYSPYYHAGIGPFLFIKDTSGYKIDKDIYQDKGSVNSVKIIGKDRIEIGDVVYLKSHDTNLNGDPALAEEFLFRGKYQMANGKEVEFTEDGKVHGLDTINYYSVEIDYYGDIMQYVDFLSMGKIRKDHTNQYGFRFNGDTLLIGRLASVSTPPYANTFGQLLYKMWRKR